MGRCLFRAESGVGADLEFGEFVFGGLVAGTGEGAEESAEEAERYGDDAGILEREEWLAVDEVRGIQAHDTRADHDKSERAEESGGKAADGALGGEPAPENGEDNDRQIGRSSDREGESDEESDVEGGAEQD